MEQCQGKKGRPQATTLPLHAKFMPHCKADVLLEFAVGTPEHANMAEARRLLEDISRYGQVPHTDLCKSSCTLNAEQTQYMIDIDMWSLLTKEEVEDILGG